MGPGAPPPHSGPIAGVRVVDFTSYIAGSYAAMMLADMGAAVVKVEALEGDSFRELPGFFGWNRGKRSIAINLKEPDGRAIVHRLARGADVAMDNMRPGVADRLGVGFEALWRDSLILVAFAVVLVAFSVRRFTKTIE